MHLTALDIQKQTFSKKFKGFNVDEVRAYLHLIAEEVERLVRDVDRLSRENAMLRKDARGDEAFRTALGKIEELEREKGRLAARSDDAGGKSHDPRLAELEEPARAAQPCASSLRIAAYRALH